MYSRYGMKRALAFILTIFIVSAVFNTVAEGGDANQDNTAQNIIKECSLSVSENADTAENLRDGSSDTVWGGSKGSTLTVKSSQPIYSIYIIWDKSPTPWYITSDNDSQETFLENGGKSGFLHEFRSFSVPVSSFTLTFNENKGAIAELYVFGAGTTPDWVQQWQPMLDKADMLVYVAHADDELLWMGGTLPVYAGEYHKKVQVAYLVRHGTAPRYEYNRNHELLDGLWKVGVTNYPMISDFKDIYTTSLAKAETKYDVDAVTGYTVMLLRRFKPEVVVSHDVNGEYGHGTHMLCAYALQQAIPISGDQNQYPDSTKQYGTWNIKKCYLHLYPDNQITMNWDNPLQAFGGKTGFEMAKEGYQCHISQLKKWFSVKEDGKYDCRKFGLYYSSVGLDVQKNDFFEHITTSTAASTATTSTITTTTTTENKASNTNQETQAANPDSSSDDLNVLYTQNSGSSRLKTLPFQLICGILFLLGVTAFILISRKLKRHPSAGQQKKEKQLARKIPLDIPTNIQYNTYRCHKKHQWKCVFKRIIRLFLKRQHNKLAR